MPKARFRVSKFLMSTSWYKSCLSISDMQSRSDDQMFSDMAEWDRSPCGQGCQMAKFDAFFSLDKDRIGK